MSNTNNDSMLGDNITNLPFTTITAGVTKGDGSLSVMGGLSSCSTYFGGGANGEALLTLKSDGTIIVNPTTDPNEATKVFLSALENTYGTLPAKVKRLEAEEENSRRLFYEEQDRRQSAELRLEEAKRDTKRLDYIFDLINERGVSGFASHILWDCGGLDRGNIDCAMKADNKTQ